MDATSDNAAGVRLAVEAAGGVPQLAAALGLNRTGVWRWKRVPVERAAEIEKLYGVPRAVLRPDIWGERDA
jgi:DNA-binding transcriptional regulator YdaS (Cro superfamily)